MVELLLAVMMWVALGILLRLALRGWGVATPEYIGQYGESKVAGELELLPADEYFVINDLMLLDGNGMTSQIDHVVVSRFGVFVIETKCYKGWIFGNEKNRFWTQSLYAGRWGWFSRSEKHKFQNPIKQNWRHIYVLSERLRMPLRYFVNVVVFSGESSFKTPVPSNVMCENDIVSYIKSFDMELLTADRSLQVVHAICKLDSSVSKEQRENHVLMLQLHHAAVPVTNDSRPPRCPRCGAPMRLRHRHSDNAPFYGCSNYPRCRGTVNVKQNA